MKNIQNINVKHILEGMEEGESDHFARKEEEKIVQRETQLTLSEKEESERHVQTTGVDQSIQVEKEPEPVKNQL